MEIRHQKEGDLVIASLIGRLDSTTSNTVQTTLAGLIASANTMILDFSSLEYVSSAGLRSLLDIAKKCRAKSGKLLITEMKDQIREIYEIAGFKSIIPSYPTLDAARVALAKK